MLKAIVRNPKYFWIGASIVWIFICFSFYSTILKCGFGPGLADYEYQLNSHCKLNRSSAYAVYVNCTDIGDAGGFIPESIFEIAWDDDYVLAKTHPLEKPHPRMEDCSNCIPNESITYWWVIDPHSGQTMQAFTETQFEEKRHQAGVPNNLQLRNIDEAKKSATWLTGDLRDSCQ